MSVQIVGLDEESGQLTRLLGKLQMAAKELHRSTKLSSFEGDLAMSLPSNSPSRSWQFPIFVVNLDRSPHRLANGWCKKQIKQIYQHIRRSIKENGRQVSRSRVTCKTFPNR